METIEWLKDFRKKNGHQKVLAIGSSAGGYAAIVFGVAIKATILVAFAPQTNLERSLVARYKGQKLNDFRSKLGSVNHFFDLSAYLKQQKEIPPIDVYFAENFLPDKVEAEDIGKYKEVYLHPVKDTDVHAVARILKDRGELSQIVQNAISEIT